MTPAVSVCVPVYNYGRFIGDCLESVRAQTFTDWELIVCDDRSTDDTRDIVQAYAARDSRIHYVLNEQRLGMYGNFARVMSQARGTFLKPLCADDWLHPQFLETCVELMTKYPSCALVATNCVDTDAVGRPLYAPYYMAKEFYTGAEMIRREIRGQGGIGGNSSFFLRRRAYEEVGGYDSSFRYLADHVLGLRLCQVGDFAHSNRQLFYGRRHEAQSSANDPKQFLDLFDWFRIPAAVFAGRASGLRWWWIERRMIGRVGANFLVTAAFEMCRDRRARARTLVGLTWREAPVRWPIVVLLPYRLVWRVGRRILGALRPAPPLVVVSPRIDRPAPSGTLA